MDQELAKREAILRVRRFDSSTSFQVLNCEVARAIILLGDRLKVLDNFLISALAQEELGSFLETDDSDSKYSQDCNKGSHGVHEISPAAVVCSGTVTRIGT